MNAFSEIRKIVVTIQNRIDEVEEQYNTLDAERKALKKRPMTNASLYWHEDKYLYLIHPTRDGYRTRKYIGNNPKKVQGALDSLERFTKHEQVCYEMNDIMNRLLETQFSLQLCVRKIETQDK